MPTIPPYFIISDVVNMININKEKKKDNILYNLRLKYSVSNGPYIFKSENNKLTYYLNEKVDLNMPLAKLRSECHKLAEFLKYHENQQTKKKFIENKYIINCNINNPYIIYKN